MVEQQVVGLEVEGSSPSIYPLFTAGIEPNFSKINFSKTKVLLYIIITLKSKWSDFFLLTLSNHFTANNVSYMSLFTLFKPFKMNSRLLNLKPRAVNEGFKTLRRSEPALDSLRPNMYNKMIVDFDSSVDNINHLGLFKSFLKANSTLGFTNFIPHASQRSIFVKYYKKGVCFSSIPRFYSSWTNAYNLIFNIFFYKIEILTFGNAFFKNEILALNWDNKNFLNTFWRYAKPFLIFQSVKINDFGDFIFRNLNHMGYYIGLILDITYHKKTIYYLRKSKFYTIGIVPSNYNIKSVDAALPIINDTIPNQLFFIRLILLIKKNVKTHHFKEVRSFWFDQNIL